jgi:hypothetical protein
MPGGFAAGALAAGGVADDELAADGGAAAFVVVLGSVALDPKCAATYCATREGPALAGPQSNSHRSPQSHTALFEDAHASIMAAETSGVVGCAVDACHESKALQAYDFVGLIGARDFSDDIDMTGLG